MPVTVQRRNQRERNRVKTVNGGYECLRLHVPSAARSKKMSKVDILKHSIQYIQKLRSLVEAPHHHHQSPSTGGEPLRQLVENQNHQNLTDQPPLVGGVETTTSPHPFPQQGHHSPDANFHGPFRRSPNSNNSGYPHLPLNNDTGGGDTNGCVYPHHTSPTSPPLIHSPDSSDSGHASFLSFHPAAYPSTSPTTFPTTSPTSYPPARQASQDFSASQQSQTAATGFLTSNVYQVQQQTSQEDEILDVIAEWQES